MKHYKFIDTATQGYSALVAVLILLFHNRTVPAWPWLVGGHAAGLLLVHWLIQAQARRPQCPILDLLRHFYPVLLYTPLFCETGRINRMFFPDYLDAFVIRCDQALLGCQPGLVFMSHLPWLAVSEILYLSYFSYYLMIGGVGIALFFRNRARFFHYISVVSFVFYVCYLAYIILPVVGPQVLSHEVAGFSLPPDLEAMTLDDPCPNAVKAGVFFRIMAWIYRVFESPGAAFPSSHVAIALCTLFFSFRYLRPIRWPHLILVILLCASTVYCHYHYVTDVLSGVVTAAVLIPLGNRLFFRKSDTSCKPSLQSPQ